MAVPYRLAQGTRKMEWGAILHFSLPVSHWGYKSKNPPFFLLQIIWTEIYWTPEDAGKIICIKLAFSLGVSWHATGSSLFQLLCLFKLILFQRSINKHQFNTVSLQLDTRIKCWHLPTISPFPSPSKPHNFNYEIYFKIKYFSHSLYSILIVHDSHYSVNSKHLL